MVTEVEKDIKLLKKRAIEEKIPIIVDDVADFIIDFMNKKNITTVLEIGAGIGYSSILFAIGRPDAKIVSIENDNDRYMEALKNIKKFDLEDRITLVFNDALDAKIKDKFDLIFIDGKKSESKELFDLYEKNLTNHGTIITNNITFNGLMKKNPNEIVDRKLKNLIKKIKDYLEYLDNNMKYKTSFYDIGDGLSVTEKRL